MTRETKVGLLIGMGVILLIGIIVSDTLSVSRQSPPDLTDYADQSQDSIFRPGPNESYASRDQAEPPRVAPRQRQNPILTPDEVESRRRGTADEADPRRNAPQAQRQLPAALGLDRQSTPAPEGRQAPPSPLRDDVPMLNLSHDWMLDNARQTAADTGTTAPDRRESRRSDTPAGSQTIHYVERGETLYDISRKYYGSGQHWRRLAEINPDTVGREGRVVEGARLVIPNRDGLERISENFEPAGTERVRRVDQTARPTSTTIEVASGDTLSGLAARHLGSTGRWRELLEANRDQLRSATDLRAGMELKLPGADAGSSTSSASSSERRESRSAGREYTVRSGDSLTRIAQRMLGDGDRWREIYDANRDQLASPDSVRVGQTLRLP